MQGLGWLTTEELWWNDRGELGTHAPSTYKIPTCSDLAIDFRAELTRDLRTPKRPSTARKPSVSHR